MTVSVDGGSESWRSETEQDTLEALEQRYGGFAIIRTPDDPVITIPVPTPTPSPTPSPTAAPTPITGVTDDDGRYDDDDDDDDDDDWDDDDAGDDDDDWDD